MTQYQMGISVMNFLQKLKVSMANIGQAIQDENLEKSYQVIQENPQITKSEFLKAMGIREAK